MTYYSLGVNKHKKLKTYRKKARKRKIQKREKKSDKKQLGYVRRNLRIIEKLINQGGDLTRLNKKEYKNLLVAQTIYEQQSEMFKENKRSVSERIVSLTQPHLRPIVRGKAGVEYGHRNNFNDPF